MSSMWLRAKASSVVPAQPAPEPAPQGCTGSGRKASWESDPAHPGVAGLPLTGLIDCVTEDTYSSEESVDHQPVHLRVMDSADLVTLPPITPEELRIPAASGEVLLPEWGPRVGLCTSSQLQYVVCP